MIRLLWPSFVIPVNIAQMSCLLVLCSRIIGSDAHLFASTALIWQTDETIQRIWQANISGKVWCQLLNPKWEDERFLMLYWRHRTQIHIFFLWSWEGVSWFVRFYWCINKMALPLWIEKAKFYWGFKNEGLCTAGPHAQSYSNQKHSHILCFILFLKNSPL